MQEPDLFKIFIKPFNKLNLPYMVTGGAAAIVYGLPRLTHDIDLGVEINNDKVEIFLKMFSMDQFYCPPEEVIQTEINRNVKGHFNLIHYDTGFKADIYLIGNDSLHKWAIQLSKYGEVGKFQENLFMLRMRLKGLCWQQRITTNRSILTLVRNRRVGAGFSAKGACLPRQGSLSDLQAGTSGEEIKIKDLVKLI